MDWFIDLTVLCVLGGVFYALGCIFMYLGIMLAFQPIGNEHHESEELQRQWKCYQRNIIFMSIGWPIALGYMFYKRYKK